MESGADVVLGGGTQLLAVAAVVRHAGVPDPATLATTRYLADDVPELDAAAAGLNLDLTVTDPGFDAPESGPLSAYAEGVAKEGVGMGGALHVAATAGRLGAVRDATRTVLDRVQTEGNRNVAVDDADRGDDGGS